MYPRLTTLIFKPLAASLALALTGLQPAFAQSATQGSPAPVVQAVPAGSISLNEALSRLARDPRDAHALIDAGKAALAMGDIDAAIGFFNRADQVSPGNPQVKAGLARALVRNENPYDAITMFAEAEKAGASGSDFAADRGLAYDLVSDNGAAQRFYRQALAQAASDEVTRRLALSLAIAGDKAASEATLTPLLQRQDKAAWRTRAFSLAILGQVDDAVAIANQSLTPELAGAISPYLRYLPRLTPAQQAAAANFGHFPRASEIGRDDPRVAQFAPRARPQVARADAALVPRGEPLGRTSRKARNDRQVAQIPAPNLSPASRKTGTVAVAVPARAAPPDPLPSRGDGVPPMSYSPAPTRTSTSEAATAPQGPISAPAPTKSGTGPGFTSLEPTPADPKAAVPVVQAAASPKPTPVPEPVRQRPSLADAFADFGRPVADVAPVAGAVDVRRIVPARPKPPEKTKPAPPAHPSRIWVQIATGRNKAALGYDWRRMSRQAEAVFRGKSPMISAWGQTNRLLTGPFPTEASANAYVVQLRRADIEGAFVWTSPAGQVVDALPSGK